MYEQFSVSPVCLPTAVSGQPSLCAFQKQFSVSPVCLPTTFSGQPIVWPYLCIYFPPRILSHPSVPTHQLSGQPRRLSLQQLSVSPVCLPINSDQTIVCLLCVYSLNSSQSAQGVHPHPLTVYLCITL